jgi:hypothetical protein
MYRLTLAALGMAVAIAGLLPTAARAEKLPPKIEQSVDKGLEWLADQQQDRQGYWEANSGQYRVAMTALAANAMLCEGSTTTRGKYAKNIQAAVDYLLSVARPNGLIGYENDYHYTYGHGFSMLFLSQVYGEEEDVDRRERLRKVLTKAVEFCAAAQTSAGGWGYVSAKDGNGFDEGSTCITQVQGLRACRDAGIPVSREIIEKGKEYVWKCTIKSGPQAGGVQYSIRGGGARPPITAAGIAAMFNFGEYESDRAKLMLEFCKKNVWPGKGNIYDGHWHYTHYYYSQVMYRLDKEWPKYYKEISDELLRKQSHDGAWKEGHVGEVYTTAINLTILQLERGFLPIYQR